MGWKKWVRNKGLAVVETAKQGARTVTGAATAAAGTGVVIGTKILQVADKTILGDQLSDEILDQQMEYGKGVAIGGAVNAVKPLSDTVELISGDVDADNDVANTLGLLYGGDTADQAVKNIGYEGDRPYVNVLFSDVVAPINQGTQLGLQMAATEAEEQGRDETADLLEAADRLMGQYGDAVVAAVLAGYSTPALIRAALARNAMRAGFFAALAAALAAGRMTSLLFNFLKEGGALIAGAVFGEDEDTETEEDSEEKESEDLSSDDMDEEVVESEEPVLAETEPEPVPFMDPNDPTDAEYREREQVY